MRRKKCYIYTRVSTAAQVDGYSLEAQQERIRQYAAYKELEIVHEYCDAGKSGKSIHGRPAFMEMMEAITDEKDDVSAVLVFKLSRFGRNATDVLKSIQLLNDYGIALICVDDAIDSSNAGGKLTLAILSAVAEIERENINVQFTAGKMQKICEGGWPGGPVPYGYRSVNKELVTDLTEAEVVKLIFDLYLQDDMQCATVVRWLNDHGYSRNIKGEKKPFCSDGIKCILKNPVYCGRIGYNRRTNLKGANVKPKTPIFVQGKHEPIVSVEQWERVQKKLDTLAVKNQKVDDPERISMLSGIIKCPVCGRGLVATKNKHVNKNRGGYYKTLHYYSCRGYRKDAGRVCKFKHTYNQDKIDNAVLEIVENLSNLPRFRKHIAEHIGDRASAEDIQNRIRQIKRELHTYEHKVYRLGGELDNLDVLSETYNTEYDMLQSEIDKAYDEMDLLERELKNQVKNLATLNGGIAFAENIDSILQNFRKLHAKMTCEERRELCRSFIEKVEVFPEEQSDRRIIKSISFKFPVYYRDCEATSENDTPDDEVCFTLNCDELLPTVAESKATYAEIKKYVLEKTGLKIPTLYIAQIKRKYGIDVGKAYNKPEVNKNHVPRCPKEKELAIIEALKAFRMLDENIEYKE